MLKIYLPLVLLSLSLVLQNCNSTAPQKADAEITNETSPTPTQSPKIDFKGVSFTYNPQIFEIKTESIIHESPLQNESDKPGREFPNHIAFSLQVKNKLIEPEATIKILPIADYRRMYAVSGGYTKAFDENLEDLRRVLTDKNFRVKKEIPFLQFYDAHQTLEAKVKHLSFPSGEGILFLSQINQEMLLVNNEMLAYYFQGITVDGKNYVLAEFPVSTSFLPNSSNAMKFETYELCETCSENDVKEYERYISNITGKLENLPPEEFQPSLREIEKIITTLKIKE